MIFQFVCDDHQTPIYSHEILLHEKEPKGSEKPLKFKLKPSSTTKCFFYTLCDRIGHEKPGTLAPVMHHAVA